MRNQTTEKMNQKNVEIIFSVFFKFGVVSLAYWISEDKKIFWVLFLLFIAFN